MTLEEQAVLIWPVLPFAARMQRVVTYGELEGLTGAIWIARNVFGASVGST